MTIAKYKFKDLYIGQKEEMEVLIDESEFNKFIELTKDEHPLHVDEEYAQSNGFETKIAHGLLIAAYSSKMVGMQLPGQEALVLEQSFKFIKPVYSGDVLKYVATIVSMDDRFQTIDLKIRVKNQSNILVAVGNYSIKIRS